MNHDYSRANKSPAIINYKIGYYMDFNDLILFHYLNNTTEISLRYKGACSTCYINVKDPYITLI